jgi:hypothetical protein
VKAVSDWLDTQPGMITAAEREQRRLAPIAEAFAKAGVACDGRLRRLLECPGRDEASLATKPVRKGDVYEGKHDFSRN